MQKVLVVVDMQNDFIDGALGTKEAVAIVPGVKEKIENFDGVVLFTRDTHETYYLDTQEGQKLPVPHCIRDTEGWQIRSELDALRKTEPIDKETFGSTDLAGELVAMNEDNEIIVPIYTKNLPADNDGLCGTEFQFAYDTEQFTLKVNESGRPILGLSLIHI